MALVLKNCGMFFLVPLLKISKVMGAYPSSWGQEQQTQSSKAKAVNILYIILLYMLRKEDDVHLDDEKTLWFFFPVL